MTASWELEKKEGKGGLHTVSQCVNWTSFTKSQLEMPIVGRCWGCTVRVQSTARIAHVGDASAQRCLLYTQAVSILPTVTSSYRWRNRHSRCPVICGGSHRWSAMKWVCNLGLCGSQVHSCLTSERNAEICALVISQTSNDSLMLFKEQKTEEWNWNYWPCRKCTGSHCCRSPAPVSRTLLSTGENWPPGKLRDVEIYSCSVMVYVLFLEKNFF